MKRYIDTRALLLLSLTALMLGGCASTQRAEAPPASAASAPAPSREFNAAYAEALGLMREGKYEQAGTRLVALTNRYPEFAGPYVNLGLVHLHLGRGEDAERALLAAAERNPNSVTAQSLLGVAYRKEGRFEDAQRAYRRALAIDPDYADAHLNLGILLDLYMGKPAEALGHYERYRELKPGDAARVEPWIADLRRAGPRGDGRSG